ncbi:flagellar biosynthetic protein FliR [Primorskyibacter sp. S187A]|uniref:flagellar biosynthetic protein FliR n=1 Tax=Primorskyibacter sp. S187A TaxID=3415130 RepID=UPI003C7A41ED
MSDVFLLLEPHIYGFFAIFFRVSAFVAMMPGFGAASVSVRIKLGLALAFTFIVYPVVPWRAEPDWDLVRLAQLLGTETLAGFLLGIGLRLLLMGLQTAGTIAAQATSLSQVFGAAGVEPMPAMGHVLMVGGIALAMLTGLHVKAIELFVASYGLFPPGLAAAGSGVAEWGIAQVAHAFQLAFSLAMPFIVLSMLYNLALGVINKAMPQLMVAFVGAPAITLGGLVLLLAAAPVMLEVWHDALDAYLANPLAVR